MKAIYVWKGKNCAGGDLAGTIAICLAMGLDTVWLKIADGTDLAYASYPDEMYGVVDEFRGAGLGVWGWQYVYGGVRMDRAGKVIGTRARAREEAVTGRRWVEALELDGLVIDAEREFKEAGERAAEEYMLELRGMRALVGLSSYRYPSLHRDFPWETFLVGCDYHMPQVYWGAGAAGASLERSVRELTGILDLPVVAVGRAYAGDGNDGKGLVGEIGQFCETAARLKLDGVSWWSLDHTYLHNSSEEWRQAMAEGMKMLEGQTSPPTPLPNSGEGGEEGIRMRVGVPKLNLREGPGLGHRDVGDLVGNEVVQALNVSGREAWVYVEMADGRKGWACVGLNGESYLVKI